MKARWMCRYPSVRDLCCGPRQFLAHLFGNDEAQLAEIEPRLTLAQLIERIELILLENPDAEAGDIKHQLEQALESYNVDMSELEQFALFDASRCYTRNLVATDHSAYALLLLCWNRGQHSPIHDHTSTGCWIKAIQGEVHEIRYVREGNRFVETSNVTYTSGVTYMDDSLGFHKVGNPSDDVDAITMHLYTPPYEKCRVWDDPERADRGTSAVTTLYSAFGEKLAVAS